MKTQLLSLMAVAALLAVSAPAAAQADSVYIPPPRCPSEVSVNEVQDCATWAVEVVNAEINYAQDQAEAVLVLVCDIACNFASADADLADLKGPVIAFACPVTPVTVNNVQKCITYVVYYANGRIDYAQDRVEDVIDQICDIACNFVATSSFAAPAEPGIAVAATCGDVSVNGVQECLTWAVYYANLWVDFAQDGVELVLETVCDVACNFVTASATPALDLDSDVSLACGDLTVNGVQDCANWAIDTAEALACGGTVAGLQRCLNSYIDYAQYLIEYALDLVCDVACNFVSVEDVARAQ